MASLKFDIGLDIPEEMPLSPTAPSSLSSIMSTVESKIGRGASSTYENAGTSTYSSQNAFLILRDFLQPNTARSLESVVDYLADMLPENAHLSSEMYSLGVICVDMAEQIPYHHPSHQKMARLLEKLGQSVKVNGKYQLQGKPVFHLRYQRLGEYVKDRFSAGIDEDEPETYVNLNAFLANIGRFHVFHSDESFATSAAGEKSDADDECKAVAAKTADMMVSFEKNMSF
ncbi:hypothetical protein FQN54_009301 [Arachnomyces sp. PD_36]|nr:hypothetical protein FQN54_009301 [Arachnomyces sp. PD_36]